LNPDQNLVINFKEFLPKCKESRIFSEKIAPLERTISNIDFDLVYIRRKIISPFYFYKEPVQIKEFDKQLFGYIFKIKGYRVKKS